MSPSLGSCARSLLAISVVLLGACSTTSTVKQSSVLADAGIAYGRAAEEVILVTKDRYLDWESDSMLASLEGSSGCNAKEIAGDSPLTEACEARIKDFDATQTRNEKWIRDLTLLSAQAAALGRYFQSLKALSSHDVGGPIAGATEQLISRINDVSEKLEPEAKLSDAEKASWAQLAGLASEGIKATYLKNRLQEDANAIGRAIDIQGAVLNANAAVLFNIDKGNRKEIELVKVRYPYLTGEALKNAEFWRTVRRTALAPGPEVEQVLKLRSASISLKQVWKDILSGTGDAASAQYVLQDIAGALELLDDVREAKRSANAGGEKDGKL